MGSLGVRARVGLALVGVAVVSLLLTAGLTTLAVKRAVEDFGRQDLELSADSAAFQLGLLYKHDGGWTRQSVGEVRTSEDVQGHTVVVRDLAGRVLPGSSRAQARQVATAPVDVGGEQVGTLYLAHLGGGYLRLRERGSQGFSEELDQRITVVRLVGALIGIVIALVLAFFVSNTLTRPLRRLTEAAERIEAGDLDTRVATEGGAELRRLGTSIERVAAALRRQDEGRRETVKILAHELRTPVSGIRLRVEAMQDGVLTDQSAALAAMHADVLRLGRLMEDFERLTEAQQPGILLGKTPVDLSELARHRAQSFEEYFRTGGITFFCDIEPATTVGDPERIGQVIDNLLSNALRYTNRGGRVILRVLEGPDESVVEVADNGIGIAPEDLSRIFDRFWRAEKSRSRATGGSGLGLALVRELVEAHDGRVEVQSLPGRGSRFRVHLPVAGDQARAPVRFEERRGLLGPAGPPVLVARPEASSDDWRELEHAIALRVREGSTLLVVDLGEVRELGPRAVAALRGIDAEAKARQGRMVVAAPSESLVRRAIADVVAVADDLDAALAAIVLPAGEAPDVRLHRS